MTISGGIRVTVDNPLEVCSLRENQGGAYWHPAGYIVRRVLFGEDVSDVYYGPYRINRS